jgi:ABC-2 type transport system permease protein
MSSSRVLWLVAVREMKARIRNRTFVVSNLVTMLIIVGFILLAPVLFGDDPLQIGLVGDDSVEVGIVAVADQLEVEVEFQRFDSIGAAEAAIEAGDVAGVVVDGKELVVEQEAGTTLSFLVSAASSQQRFNQRLVDAGVTQEQAAIIAAPDEPIQVRPLEPPMDESFFSGFGAATAGVVLLFMGINLYGGTVLTGIVEEKSSRVVEVMLSTVRPWQLLGGKLIGLGLMGLGQLGALVALGLGAAAATDAVEVPTEAIGSAVWVIMWFVLGFALYATLYAMGGAMAARAEDAQSTAAPIGFLVLAGYLLTFAVVLPNPESIAARILSILPPFAPFAMPGLITLGEAALWQILASVVLTIGAIGVMVRVAGRVYAGAILKSNERVKIREALRSARHVLGS